VVRARKEQRAVRVDRERSGDRRARRSLGMRVAGNGGPFARDEANVQLAVVWDQEGKRTRKGIGRGARKKAGNEVGLAQRGDVASLAGLGDGAADTRPRTHVRGYARDVPDGTGMGVVGSLGLEVGHR